MNVVAMIVVLTLLGCQKGSTQNGATSTSKDAAVQHLSSEIEAWMNGHESDAKSLDALVDGFQHPIAFEVKSVLDEKPSPLATASDADFPLDWKTWPAYRVNVALEFQSQSGGSIKKIVVYTMTFNTSENRWYIRG